MAEDKGCTFCFSDLADRYFNPVYRLSQSQLLFQPVKTKK